jgi:hypothetical protein
MEVFMSRFRSLALLGVILGFGLTACGSNSTGSSTATTMSADEATGVGNVTGGLISGAASSVALFAIDDGTLTDPSLAPSLAARRRAPIMAVLRAGARLRPDMAPAIAASGGILGDCDPTVSNTTDTDGDGIYDDVTATFTADNCSYTNQAGQSVVVTGSIRERDQGEIFGFMINFNSLRYVITGQSATGSLTIGGSYSTNVGPDLATAGESLHLVLTSSVDPSIEVSEAWALTFTPDATIEAAATELPAGSFTLAGSLSIGRDNRHWALILVSTDPLVYDGVCASEPPFASGSIEGQIASARTHGFHMQFNGCGSDATITVLGSGA